MSVLHKEKNTVEFSRIGGEITHLYGITSASECDKIPKKKLKNCLLVTITHE